MKVMVIPIVIGTLGTILKGLIRGLEELEKLAQADTIHIEVGQNTKKSPRDLRRLAVTQSPIKEHQLTLVGKTHKE